MANNLTNYAEDLLLNWLFRNNPGAVSPPATVYAALFTVAPGEAGGGTEVSGGSYARTAITFGAPSSNTIANSSAVNFPTASGSWGTVTDMAVMDASTSGNMLAYGPLAASKTVGSGDSVSFAIGALTINFN